MGHKARVELVLDCAEPGRLAKFWREALDYRDFYADENLAVLVPKEGIGSPLLLQCVPEPKAGKNRMHLDIVVEDIDTELHRLQGLGAGRIDEGVQSFGGTRWVRMSDPSRTSSVSPPAWSGKAWYQIPYVAATVPVVADPHVLHCRGRPSGALTTSHPLRRQIVVAADLLTLMRSDSGSPVSGPRGTARTHGQRHQKPTFAPSPQSGERHPVVMGGPGTNNRPQTVRSRADDRFH